MDANGFPAGMRVLAVDDDSVCIKLLEQQLQLCKYDVTTTMSGEAALEMLRARKDEDQFDLVISDVFMPGMDGFKLLEHIGLEMDIPVIMLSANSEKETIIKGITHGACDYLVKPVRMEQLMNIWVHVVKKSKPAPRNLISGGNDHAGQKLLPGDGEGEMNGANRTRKNSRKNKKDWDGHVEDKENSSTQKRQRIKWCRPLHNRFLAAVEQIGIDKAVPKKILERMNVDGISRENVASHLQKYRLYLRRLSLGSFRHSQPFVSTNMNILGTCNCKHHSELGTCQPSPPFAGSLNTGNPFARLNSPSALGSGHGLLPTQSVQLVNSPRSLGININDAVPRPVQDSSKFISSGNSYANVQNGDSSGVSNYFLSGISSSSNANVASSMVLNTSKSFPSAISGRRTANVPSSMVFNTSTSFPSGTYGSTSANISKDTTPPLSTSHRFPSYGLDNSYAKVLRGKFLGSASGIPFDSDDSFEEMENGGMLPPSSPSPLQPPEFSNQPSVQVQSSSAVQFANPISNFSSSWNSAAPPRFPNLGHKDGTSQGPSQTCANGFMINQLSRLATSSGQTTPFANEFQNHMAAIMKKSAPIVGLSDQVGPFNLGSNADSSEMLNGNSALSSVSSFGSTLPNLQMDNPIMPTEMLNGGDASGNLPEEDGGTIDQLAVGDPLDGSNEAHMGTGEAQNQMSDDFDAFLADLLDQDFLSNDDAVMDGDWALNP
ncbi:hypothetical protein ACP70R_043429 [Stipagrostis hirtigluma subsp. patula]